MDLRIFVCVISVSVLLGEHSLADEPRDDLIAWEAKSLFAALSIEDSSLVTNASVRQSIVLDDDLVVANFPPDQVLAVDDRSGRRLWTWPPNARTRLLAIQRAKPYVARWRFDASSLCYDPERKSFISFSGGANPELSRLSKDGRFSSFFSLHANDVSSIISSPVVFKDELISLAAVSGNYALLKISLGTGEFKKNNVEIGSYDVTSGASLSMCIFHSLAVVLTTEGFVFGIEVDSGRVVWRTKLDGFDGPRVHRTHICNTKYMVHNGRECACIDTKDGSVLWIKRELDPRPFVLQGNYVFVGSSTKLFSINSGTGASDWEIPLKRSHQISSEGCVHGDLLLLPSKSRFLMVIRLNSGEVYKVIDSGVSLGRVVNAGSNIYSLSPTGIVKIKAEIITEGAEKEQGEARAE